jgi:hypothetical protein
VREGKNTLKNEKKPLPGQRRLYTRDRCHPQLTECIVHIRALSFSDIHSQYRTINIKAHRIVTASSKSVIKQSSLYFLWMKGFEIE